MYCHQQPLKVWTVVRIFSVLLCAMSTILFLAWHRRDHQHNRNSSASPRENSANKGHEQGVYLIHHEQFLKLTPKF